MASQWPTGEDSWSWRTLSEPCLQTQALVVNVYNRQGLSKLELPVILYPPIRVPQCCLRKCQQTWRGPAFALSRCVSVLCASRRTARDRQAKDSLKLMEGFRPWPLRTAILRAEGCPAHLDLASLISSCGLTVGDSVKCCCPDLGGIHGSFSGDVSPSYYMVQGREKRVCSSDPRTVCTRMLMLQLLGNVSWQHPLINVCCY